MVYSGTFLMVQWLRLRVSTTGGTSLIPGQGTKILHATQCGQKKKSILTESPFQHQPLPLLCHLPYRTGILITFHHTFPVVLFVKKLTKCTCFLFHKN